MVKLSDVKFLELVAKIKGIQWRLLVMDVWRKIRKFKFKKTAFYRGCKKLFKKISDSWKIVLTVVPLFLFFYYVVGSMVVEKIDTETACPIERKEGVQLFQTSDCMAFLIKREVDDKMWTPNLPILFPAYVLDNMPNFQIGILSAVKDVTGTLRYFKSNTEAQNKDIKEAYKLLGYAPDVWLMSKRGKFNLAPSSNSQYRRAGKELRKFTADGIYTPSEHDLRLLLKKISSRLQKLSADSEAHQREYSSNWLDFNVDNLFYHHKGYAFAMWQMLRALCNDYKDIIVENNLYEDWTRMSASLQKAAEYSPFVIRNGGVDSVFTPNHLMTQNYYLLRSVAAAEKIRANLSEAVNAN